MEPPPKGTEVEDPGAHELASSDGDEDHFSDASEGQTSPIPKTRVEKVDDTPSHGQVPGSSAFDLRKQDAVPDELEIIPETGAVSTPDGTSTPGGTPIPKTIVEKVDPDQPSHGEVPGTAAYEQRRADATPDVVVKAGDPGSLPPAHLSQGGDSDTNVPIPETVVTKVDSEPSHGEVPGTKAHEIRKADASPDVTEVAPDVSDPSIDVANRP